MQIDIVITADLVVTMDEKGSIFEPGAVAIDKDEIVGVGGKDEIKARYQGKEEIVTKNSLVMPGLINIHTHAPMTVFRGLADDLPLMTWLTEYIFPAEKKLTRDIVFKGTLLACAEMILGGTTTFVDMYLYADQVGYAAKEASMRAVIGEVLYDFASPNYGPPEEGIKFTERLIKEWEYDKLISVAVQPHTVYTCSPGLLRDSHELATNYNVPYIIHLSENEEEVKIVKGKYGKTPVEHVYDLGLLGPRFLGVHCVKLTESDIEILAGSGASVAHSPESNMKLASGICPVPALLDKRVTVGLGTDGCASNNDLDLWGEMDTCAKLHKVTENDPTVLPAEKVVRMATIDGAKAVGMENDVGSLETGKKADIIVIDLDKPHLTPMYQVYSHLVYAASSSDVVLSIINGKVVMKERVLQTVEVEEVIEDVRKIAADVIRSNA